MIRQTRAIKRSSTPKIFSNRLYSSYFTNNSDKIKNLSIDTTNKQFELVLETGITEALNALTTIEKHLNTSDTKIITTKITVKDDILQITYSLDNTDDTKSTIKNH
ncbi:MAG: hypothetical protein Barrevirus1_22 [Barrevirus sp.]|uniref:Uncharacterized protein n=1 Tax=Barrevirus sp. TaxID=2487763 RepID=A0A3G4ZPI2_9VIRU|nr:MAG: hypothetical protein Barrevirus1_22 [Barrevirus sp.]